MRWFFILFLFGCATYQQPKYAIQENRVCHKVKNSGYYVWCYECYQTVEQGEIPSLTCGDKPWEH